MLKAGLFFATHDLCLEKHQPLLQLSSTFPDPKVYLRSPLDLAHLAQQLTLGASHTP